MIGNLPETKWRGFCLRNPQGNPQKSAGKHPINTQKHPIKNPYQKSLSKIQAIRRNPQKRPGKNPYQYAEIPKQKHPKQKRCFFVQEE